MGNCGCNNQSSTSTTTSTVDTAQEINFDYSTPKEYPHEGCRKHPHLYFEDYTALEKLLVIENLGIGGSTVSIQNNPDEEDLTQVLENNKFVLKFKDKVYSPNNHSGYGKVYLRKNITKIEDCPTKTKNILLLSVFLDSKGYSMDHTIFIILYDFDLDGKFIEIPADSILLFEGGSLQNGTIILDNTLVFPWGINFEKTMPSLNIRGTYANGLVLYKDDKLQLYVNGLWYNLSLIVTSSNLEAAVATLQSDLNTLSEKVATLDTKIETLNNLYNGLASSPLIIGISSLIATLSQRISDLSTAANKPTLSFNTDVINSTDSSEYSLGTLFINGSNVVIKGKDNLVSNISLTE